MATTIQNPPSTNPNHGPEDDDFAGKQMSFLEHLEEHGTWYALESDIDKVIGEVDVVYQTRILPDRLAGPQTPGGGPGAASCFTCRGMLVSCRPSTAMSMAYAPARRTLVAGAAFAPAGPSLSRAFSAT